MTNAPLASVCVVLLVDELKMEAPEIGSPEAVFTKPLIGS